MSSQKPAPASALSDVALRACFAKAIARHRRRFMS
jgi:hypothetical protein